MKNKKAKKVLALVMVFILVAAFVPMDWAKTNVSAAGTKYVFDASAESKIAGIDKKAPVENGTYGTDGYFTLTGTVTRGNSDNPISAELAKGAEATEEAPAKQSGELKFTVTGTADVVISATSTGGSNTSEVVLVKDGSQRIKADGAESEVNAVVGTKPATEIKYTGLEAGEYSILVPLETTYNRGVRVIKVEVDVVEVAAVTKDFTFDASAESKIAGIDKKAPVENGTYGTDGYFTLTGTVTRGNSDNPISAELAKGAEATEEAPAKQSGELKFTVTGTADVVISATSTGGSNTSEVVLVKDGSQRIKADGAESEVNAVVGTKPATEIKYTGLEAGEYSILVPLETTYNRGVRIINVVATQTSGGERPDRKAWADVAAPVIGDITASGSTITVPYTMEVGYDGADKVVVTMASADGSVKTATGAKTNGSVEFSGIATSGTYTFSIVAMRENEADKAGAETKTFEFLLPLATPQIGSATSVGNGTIELEWAAVPEATEYEVSYSSDGGNNFGDAKTTTDTKYQVTGLTVGETYTFKVVAKRGSEVSQPGTIVGTATQDAQSKWANATYGNGASPSKDKITGSANDGSVTIESHSGKIVPGSTDGLSFHYTAVPKGTNFTLKAKVTVDSWLLSNGQEGFGMMATDWVGAHDGLCWTNSYMLGASKCEYFVDMETKEVTTNTDSTVSAKITQKLGMLAQEKKGVTLENLSKLEANDTATVQNDFKVSSVPVDFAEGHLYATVDENGKVVAGTMNTIGNAASEVAGTVSDPITEMYLTIQKNNTGYFLTYTDMNGNEYTKKYYEPDALEKVDTDFVYVGFYASRNATATFSDIEFKTILASDDEAAEGRPVEYIAVNTTVQSPTSTGVSEYNLNFTANCDGVVSAVNAAGQTLAEGIEVKANKSVFVAKVELANGKNVFNLVFKPNDGYHPDNDPYKMMESYDEITIEHIVTYKTYGNPGQAIYVAPEANGSGSKDDPMNIYNAVKFVQPGQQIIIKEGTYLLDNTVKVARGVDGTAESPIVMMADPQASSRPVFDFQGLCAGMIFAGNHWYIKGFDVIHSQDAQKGIQVSGNNNTLDQVNAYYNGSTGIQISRYLTTDEFELWPENNLILNCTSYNNADAGCEDADGFAAKLTVGNGNVFDGCMAYYNADDGWDLFAKVQTGSIGAVTVKNCVTFKNGYVKVNSDKSTDRHVDSVYDLDMSGRVIDAGNGNGFKLGGDSMSGYHVLENSVVYDNKAKGIDSNSCPDIQVKGCVTYNNGNPNVAFYTNNAANTDFAMKYTVSYRQGTDVAENVKPRGTQDVTKYDNDTNYLWKWVSSVPSTKANDVVVKGAYDSSDEKLAVNTWFESLDTTQEITRNADGTLNFGPLFKFTDKAPAELRANGFDGSKVTKSATITVYQSVPATGDSSNMWVYAIILIVAAVGVAACVIVTIRKKKNQ